MSSLIIVVDRLEPFPWVRAGDRVITAEAYLRGDTRLCGTATKVLNLCAGLQQLGTAHFCSMIAEARHQKVLPSAAALLDLASPELWKAQLSIMGHGLWKGADLSRTGRRTFSLVFGDPGDPAFEAIGRRIYAAVPHPLLRLTLAFGRKPRVAKLTPLTVEELDDPELRRFRAGIERHAHGGTTVARKPPPFRLAVLHDPMESLAPSKPPALHKFVQAGAEMNVEAELIRKRDFRRLSEFDALFIRATTALDGPTYRFAQQAELLGIPVIDDPTSIRRCTNKVYLAELFQANGIPHPRTWILRAEMLKSLEQMLPLPVVLKLPDGAFGLGVDRAATATQLGTIAARMLMCSKLIVAQEFVASEFDWRVGVLAGRPLFAARYFMCPRHWQILKHVRGRHTEGRTQAVPLDQVPEEVVRQAVRAASLVGDGLYGVDLKESGRGPLVIEVNDNPNIDVGLEDAVPGDRLYREIVDHFRLLIGRRLSARQRVAGAAAESGLRPLAASIAA